MASRYTVFRYKDSFTFYPFIHFELRRERKVGLIGLQRVWFIIDMCIE
jgi:hypothetical protein